MSGRRKNDKIRKEGDQKFNKEIRSFFKHGGTLDKGVSRGVASGPQAGSQVYVDAIPLNYNKDCCVKMETAAFLAKVIEKTPIEKFIEFDTGIGNNEYIRVDENRNEFSFDLDGLYQLNLIVNTQGDNNKLIILRNPPFEPSLEPFYLFDLSISNMIDTILPIHQGDKIKIKLKGVTILPGTQIRIVRVGEI